MATPPRFLPTALPVALPIARHAPRVEPPPLPGQRDLNQLGTGADYRSHRGAGLGDTIQGAPLDSWVDVVSTWVLRSMYRTTHDVEGNPAQVGDWYVEFLDGSLVVYHNTSNDVWVDFFNSSSKGQFIYYRCKEIHRDYETLRGPQRTVSNKHRFLRDVLPGRSGPRLPRYSPNGPRR